VRVRVLKDRAQGLDVFGKVRGEQARLARIREWPVVERAEQLCGGETAKRFDD
jgi:hypothetical protein